jgi:hypothetical protein
MLQKIRLRPGLDKQSSDTGAEGKWVNGDYMRFRYSFPEKIGGWQQLGSKSLVGAGRDSHTWTDIAGNKYAAIGTNKMLYIYFEGGFHDITPLDTTRQQTSATITTTTSSDEVTITTSSDHGADPGDIITFAAGSTTVPTGSSYVAADFNDVIYEVITTPTSTTFTITMASNEGTGQSAGGSTTVDFYYVIGPVTQGYGYGWGTNTFGGRVIPPVVTTLNGAITDTTTTTGITLTSSTSFTAAGTIQIDDELISYTSINASHVLQGATRGASGSEAATHSDGATVYDATNYVGFGSASSTSSVVIEPAQWRLVNYGENLIALVHNKKVFEWTPSLANLDVRATVVSGAPTASRDMIVSTPDRHLVFIGTEVTIGTSSSQDDMFIRWSDQEDINTYAPTATNTAGSQRLTDGSKLLGAISGKTAIYLWSDTSMFTMKFIGQPFTFGFQQVGTNCGAASQHGAIEVDGIAYWMGPTGFFRFDGGRVHSLPCLVEDYVYEDLNTNANQQIHGAVNNLFGEVTWFYPTSGSDYIDRSVTYNYMESAPQNPIWTVSSLARTTWSSEGVYAKPYATSYSTSEVPTVPTVQGATGGASTYWEQEKGTDQVTAAGTTTAIAAYVESGDYDITQDQREGITFKGDSEFMMRVSRIIPDFGSQTGDAQITLSTKQWPTSTADSTSYTSTTSTTKLDTRIRGRQMALKVGNTGTGETWRMGTFRLDVHAGGRR